MRSKGSPNPKEAGQQAVALHTAAAGPEGAPIKRKYLRSQTKSTRSKTSGNSGNTGRAFRRYQRGHGGGQVSNEEKANRLAQSNRAVAERTGADATKDEAK